MGVDVAVNNVEQAAAAIQARGVTVHIVDTAAQALELVKQLIPADASVMTGSSQSLQQIGFEDLLLSKSHPWRNLKDTILAEPDFVKQTPLRRQATLADYYLGSVQAIAETGEIVIASGTGSQLPAYAYSSPNVIWIAGTQKIVPTLADAVQRVREYCLPQEDARFKALGYPGARLGKMLIFEMEAPPEHGGRNINLILVNETIGV
jgi:L-lactate utilization protein LutC